MRVDPEFARYVRVFRDVEGCRSVQEASQRLLRKLKDRDRIGL